MVDRGFRDQAVVVTGAGGGIGAALAQGFATSGAVVGCADIDGDGAERIAESITAAGGRAWSAACDVADPQAVDGLVERCLRESGPPAVLVANAGGSRGDVRPLLEMTLEAWEVMLMRNLQTVFVSCRGFARAMAEAEGGSIVVVSSQLSVVVRPGMAHYVSAKGAVTQFVKAAAVDLAPFGIRVNALAPGPTRTPGNAAFFEQSEVIEAHAKNIPLGRVAQPEEMVGAAMYLAGPSASYTTGATLMVDGGYTIV